MYSRHSRESVKRRQRKRERSEAEDDNEAALLFIRRTLPIFNCVDYKNLYS